MQRGSTGADDYLVAKKSFHGQSQLSFTYQKKKNILSIRNMSFYRNLYHIQGYSNAVHAEMC